MRRFALIFSQVSFGEMTSNATSGGNGAGPFNEPAGNRSRRTTAASGHSQSPEAIVNATSAPTQTQPSAKLSHDAKRAADEMDNLAMLESARRHELHLSVDVLPSLARLPGRK